MLPSDKALIPPRLQTLTRLKCHLLGVFLSGMIGFLQNVPA
jgi:hypothetical protein